MRKQDQIENKDRKSQMLGLKLVNKIFGVRYMSVSGKLSESEHFSNQRKNKHMNYAIYIPLKNKLNQLLRKVSDLRGTET